MGRFLSISDLKNLPPPRWLVKDLFEVDSLVMVAGPPGSYKSFLVLDWALSCALGKPWHTKSVAPSKVIYALGEGKNSFLKRIKAWTDFHQLTKEEHQLLQQNFKITFEVPQLATRKSVDEFVYDIGCEDYDPSMLVIDTYARSLVGKDENNQMDAGLWVDSADYLRKLGMAVIVLHHTAKNTEFGLRYRGSTALMGAMDSAYTLQKAPDGNKGYIKLECSKQKDHAEPEPMWFKTQKVAVNDQVDSVVLLPSAPPETLDKQMRIEQEQAIDEIINDLIANTAFESDRARARTLAEKTNRTEAWAQTRISRTRRNG